MRFNTLVTIEINHAFYPVDWGKVFEIEPTLECRQLMKRFALLFRAQTNGFQLVYHCQETSPYLPVRPLDETVTFEFTLTANDTRALGQADLPAVSTSNTCYYISNAGTKIEQGDTRSGLYLKENSAAGGIEVGTIPWKQSLKTGFVKPFAIIALQVSAAVPKPFGFIDPKQLPQSKTIKAIVRRDFQIRFQSRSSYWRYHIIPKYSEPQSLKGLRISNDNNGTAQPTIKAIEFKEMTDESIPRIAASEKTFVSQQTIPSSVIGYRNLVLYGKDGSVPLIFNLPNPDGMSISLENGDYYSDIIVYV